MMKIKSLLRLLRRLGGKSEVAKRAWLSGQRRVAGEVDQPEERAFTKQYTPHSVSLQLAQHAMEAAVNVDDLRQRWASGDPLRDQLLANIQAGFVENIADVGRKLRRSGGQDGQR